MTNAPKRWTGVFRRSDLLCKTMIVAKVLAVAAVLVGAINPFHPLLPQILAAVILQTLAAIIAVQLWKLV